MQPLWESILLNISLIDADQRIKCMLFELLSCHSRSLLVEFKCVHMPSGCNCARQGMCEGAAAGATLQNCSPQIIALISMSARFC